MMTEKKKISHSTRKDTMNQMIAIVQNSGLVETKAQSILALFQPWFEQAAEMERNAKALVVTDASQVKEMQQAKSMRLQIRKIRTAAEKAKKEGKAGILAEGKVYDGLFNLISGLVTPLEAHLEAQETFIERQEAERRRKLVLERREAVAHLGADTSFVDLGAMTEEQRVAYVRQCELAKVERERMEKEEAEREKVEADERARVQRENEKLRIENLALRQKQEADAEAVRAAKEIQAAVKVELEVHENRSNLTMAEQFQAVCLQLENIDVPETKDKYWSSVADGLRLRIEKTVAFLDKCIIEGDV
jgi:hypothetical protein